MEVRATIYTTIVLFLLLIGIPLAIINSQQQQTIKQRASTLTPHQPYVKCYTDTC